MPIEDAVIVAPAARASQRVAGLTLLDRALFAAWRGGVKRAIVVGGAQPGARRPKGLTIELAVGDGLAAARPLVRGPVLVISAEHVFEPSLVTLAAATPLDGAEAVAVGEAIIVATPAWLEGGGAAPARAVPAGEIFVVRVDSDATRARAEAGLFRLLRKRVDGPVARHVNRPVSLAVTRQIIDTPITPNQISIGAGILGLAGVWVVYVAASWWALLAGALLLQIQSILDGCDGEMARLKYLHSTAGEWIDNVIDDVLNVLYCAALGAAASRFTGSAWPTWAGIAGAVGFAIYSAVLYHQLATVHKSGSPFHFRWWFQREGEDLKAALERPGLVPAISAFFRAIGRRDAFILLFAGLVLVRLPQLAAGWYAIVGVSNGAVALIHTAVKLTRKT